MKLYALMFAALTLTSCASVEERQSRSLRLSPFQEEVVAWYSAANEMRDTGQELPARSECEGEWRAWHVAWGEETHRALSEGMRQPERIHDLVVARTGEHERRLIDACVRHGHELVEVLAFVDFDKDNLMSTIYSAVETYIRSQ